MQVTSLGLKNFRNYADLKVNFDPRFNFIFGKNAQGKTNLLEVIYYLANLKSFRTSTLADLMNDAAHQQLSTLIEARLSYGDASLNPIYHDIRIQIENGKKEVLLNNKKPRLFQEYYGLLPVLLFEPWEVYLFRESPSLRRRFIDRAVFLENPASLRAMKEYDSIIAHKNRYLKDRGFAGGDQELSVWNERQALLGAELMNYRLRWVQRINQYLQEEYQLVSGVKDSMRVSYLSSLTDLSLEETSQEELQNLLSERIFSKKEEELRRRECLVGPHRDDWEVFLSHDRTDHTVVNHNVGTRGSQGENRCAVIALKSAQIKMYIQTHKQAPVFLLDDIVSELDAHRSETLFSYLLQTPGQVFLTTTEPAKILSAYRDKGASYLVEKGCLKSF